MAPSGPLVSAGVVNLFVRPRPSWRTTPRNARMWSRDNRSEVPGFCCDPSAADWTSVRRTCGGPYRDRTDDIHGVNVALYQLS